MRIGVFGGFDGGLADRGLGSGGGAGGGLAGSVMAAVARKAKVCRIFVLVTVVGRRRSGTGGLAGVVGLAKVLRVLGEKEVLGESSGECERDEAGKGAGERLGAC